MPTATPVAGTRIFIQSAIGTAQALTGIAKANPAVIDYSGGTDPANGNYVALTSMYGMTEFEDALVKVANVNTVSDTFEAEDQNSTAYGTFSAGNMQVVTLGTELLTPTGFSMDGAVQQFFDYQYIWDKIGRRIPTTKSALTVTMPAIWDLTDPGHAAILAADDASAKLGIKILTTNSIEILFFGYVSGGSTPTAQDINGVFESTISITAASRPRFILP